MRNMKIIFFGTGEFGIPTLKKLFASYHEVLAVVTQPELILADEPTGNLDPKNKKKILELLFKYCKEEETTLITVTHDHELLPDFDKVIDFSKLLIENEE